MGEPRPLHEQLAPLAGLLGSWQGAGRGDYPTIEPFLYGERVTFAHVGKPFLTYEQRTWDPDSTTAMHAEVGYLRLPWPTSGVPDPADPRPAELVLAHPTGIVEIQEGELQDGVLRLVSTHIGRSGTAKQVRSLRREFRLDGDTLDYDLWMAYAEVPETHHLHASLRRLA